MKLALGIGGRSLRLVLPRLAAVAHGRSITGGTSFPSGIIATRAAGTCRGVNRLGKLAIRTRTAHRSALSHRQTREGLHDEDQSEDDSGEDLHEAMSLTELYTAVFSLRHYRRILREA